MKRLNCFIILLAVLLVFSSCGSNIGNEITIAETELSTELFSSEIISAVQFGEIEETTINNAVSQKAENTEAVPNKDLVKADSGMEDDADNAISTVVLSVNCKNAIDYGILNIGTYASVLSSDGVILDAVSIEISDGDSVMKTLKKALKENGVTFSITSSGYIRTINGLSEFDCGEASGWLYLVNGVMPSVSTKSYQLHSGDKIEIVYTCTQGDV